MIATGLTVTSNSTLTLELVFSIFALLGQCLTIYVVIHNRQKEGTEKARVNFKKFKCKCMYKDDLLRSMLFFQQKIFYICAKDGWIVRYYIADFYVPDKCIIIEVDGKFHENRRQHDKDRTKNIQESYPEVEVLRYTWQDLSDQRKMQDLLHQIK